MSEHQIDLAVDITIQNTGYQTKPGPFVATARELDRHGLAVFPVFSKTNDRLRFVKLKKKLTDSELAKAIRFCDQENIAVSPPLSGVAIVTSTRCSVADLEAKFGVTPLITHEPDHRVNLWYRSNHERYQRVFLKGNASATILGVGAPQGMLVTVPPSVSCNGEQYGFTRGSWSDLEQLPMIKSSAIAEKPSAIDFKFTEEKLNELAENGDAVILLVHLRFKVRQERPHSDWHLPFDLSLKTLQSSDAIQGWGLARYRSALTTLLDKGFVEQVHHGGGGRGDASRYQITNKME